MCEKGCFYNVHVCIVYYYFITALVVIIQGQFGSIIYHAQVLAPVSVLAHPVLQLLAIHHYVVMRKILIYNAVSIFVTVHFNFMYTLE